MRRYFSLFLIFICMYMLCSCSNNQSENVVDEGLVINSISFGLGGELDNTLVTYNFNIWNKTRKAILIKSIEPIINEPLKQRVIDSKLILEVNKTINGTSSENFTGSFSLNTKGIDKQGIENLNIQLQKFRIITEQVLGIEAN
ncbi:hypothetical protein D3C81_1657540 [compost metagenome]